MFAQGRGGQPTCRLHLRLPPAAATPASGRPLSRRLPSAAACCAGVGALFGSLALKWTTFGLSLVVAMHISAAMCWHLYVVDPIHAPITCSIAAALASAACLLAGYGYDQRCMRALGLLVLALLQLLSCLLSIQRMLLLLGGRSHGTVVTHIVAYALPPAITGKLLSQTPGL